MGYIAAIVAAALIAAFAPAPARAQTQDTCLYIRNNRATVTTVTADGFNEQTGYWDFQPGETAFLAIGGDPIRAGQGRGANGPTSFTIHLYSGSGINQGASLPGNNQYVNWTFNAGPNLDGGRCSSAWEATLHD